MRAEAASLDDWSALSISSLEEDPLEEDEQWHVALGPDDVKVVSLEQLDDMFRLSIVDAETRVWQPGMSDWQPLGLIAGLDDKPAPEPKRTHPKPPSPRSAPPPPTSPPQQSVASQASYALAPPARPRSVPPPSRAAVPQALRSAPPMATALAPVYPQHAPTPIAVMPQPQHASFQSPASVLPLTVRRPPVTARRGSSVGPFLVVLALIAGGSITLYRNGLVREGAHALHQDALYARLESALGGPAFDTVAPLEPSVPAARAALIFGGKTPTPSVNAAKAATATQVNATATQVSATATQVSATALVPAATGSAPPVVSLESLAPEKQVTSPSPKPAAVSPSPAPPRTVSVAPAKSVAPARPAPARPAPARPAPAIKPTPSTQSAPSTQKPESEMSERERLNAAIGRTVAGTSSKGSKSNASAYDPLNPQL